MASVCEVCGKNPSFGMTREPLPPPHQAPLEPEHPAGPGRRRRRTRKRRRTSAPLPQGRQGRQGRSLRRQARRPRARRHVQGVIKSYDPGTGRRRRDLRHRPRPSTTSPPDALEGSVFRMLRQGQRVIFDLDDDGAGHQPAPRLRGRHGHARVPGRPGPRLTAGRARRPAPTTSESRRAMTATTDEPRSCCDWVDEWAARAPARRDRTGATAPRRSTTACCRAAGRGRHVQAARPRPSGPNSYLARSDPGDVARVEDRTFICSRARDRRRPHQQLAGPGRDEGRAARASSRGAMQGRTMYVVPFSMGPLGSPIAHIGVQLTDSRLRRGEHADHDPHGPGRPRRARRRRRVRALRALGRRPARRADGARPDVPWPCDADNKYIVHFPETREIWSLRLGLRRQRPARQEVLRPAHRLDDGPRRRLAGRAHAHPRRHAPRAARSATSPPRSRRPAARPTWRC